MAYIFTIVGAIRVLELHFGLCRIAGTRGRSRRHALAAWPARQCDQRHVAASRGDGLRCMRDQHQIGGAADIGGIHVPHAQVHIVDHRERAHAGCVPRAEIAVDVLLGEPGVFQSALGAFRVKLRHRLVGRPSGGVLESTSDISAPLQIYPWLHSVSTSILAGSISASRLHVCLARSGNRCPPGRVSRVLGRRR